MTRERSPGASAQPGPAAAPPPRTWESGSARGPLVSPPRPPRADLLVTCLRFPLFLLRSLQPGSAGAPTPQGPPPLSAAYWPLGGTRTAGRPSWTEPSGSASGPWSPGVPGCRGSRLVCPLLVLSEPGFGGTGDQLHAPPLPGLDPRPRGAPWRSVCPRRAASALVIPARPASHPRAQGAHVAHHRGSRPAGLLMPAFRLQHPPRVPVKMPTSSPSYFKW